MSLFAHLFGLAGPSGFGSASTADQVATKYADQVKGKTVLVTGANSGIGKETARVLAKHGATVYVGARSAEKAKETIAAIAAEVPGANLRPFVADLSSLKSIKSGVDAFLAENVPLHILINNAGACRAVGRNGRLSPSLGGVADAALAPRASAGRTRGRGPR